MPKTKDKASRKKQQTVAATFSEEVFKDICERIPGVVTVYNIHTGKYLYVNVAVKKILGYKPDDFINGGMEFAVSLVHPEDIERIMQKNDRALTAANSQKHKDIVSEPIVSFDYRMRHKQGHWIWLHTDGSVFNRKEGKVDCVLNVSLDISAHKETELKLAKSKTKVETAERFVLSQKTAKVGTFEWNVDNEQVTVSPELEQLYGVKQGSFRGGYSDWLDYIHRDDRQKVDRAIQRSVRGNQLFNLEFRINKKGGESRWMLGRGELTKKVKDKSKIFIGVNVDISDRKKAEENLKKSEELLSLAHAASGLGIWEWDIVSGKLNWSDQLKKIYGLKPKDSVSYERYISLLHPKDLPHIQEVIKNAQQSGEGYQIEHRIIHPDGSVHWVLGQGRAFIKNKKLVRMIGTSMDIDERKAAENLRVKMAALSAESKKLLELNQAKDEFVAITSHQLRTPATGIKQYLGLLLEGYAEPITKTQRNFLEKAYENNERQLHLIDEFLRIAQLDLDKVRLNYERINLQKLIGESIDSLANIFKVHTQKVVLATSDKPIFAKIDKEHIRLVVENLLENASNYSADGTKISIKISNTNSKVKIEIKDQGVGIKESDVSKLFQKFSRIQNPLSDSVSGTGLGLYFSKKIIELHQGKIEVSSSINKGSEFVITLPS